MAKRISLQNAGNLLQEVLFLRYFFLTGSRKEAYIFANGGNVTANENSLKVLSSRYFKNASIQNILEREKAEMATLCANFLTKEGYQVISPKEIVRNRAGKIYNENIGEGEGEDEQFNLSQGIDGINEEDRGNLLAWAWKKHRSTQNLDDQIKLSNLIEKITKKEDPQGDSSTIRYYLPKRECTNCPHLKQILKDDELKPYVSNE